MEKYRIYKEGNYIILSSDQETFYGAAKDVAVDKNNKNKPNYRFFNIVDWDENKTLDLSQILKQDNSPYTEGEFDTFYRKKTKVFNSLESEATLENATLPISPSDTLIIEQNGVYNQVAVSEISTGSGVKLFNKASASYTGTTAETILGTPILIPANTFKDLDALVVSGIFQKVEEGGFMFISIYINSSASLSGAELIYRPSNGGSFSSSIFSHTLRTEPYIIKSNNLFGSWGGIV